MVETSLNFPKTGNLAPSFTLKNQDGDSISLKDFRGSKVLVYFYPKASTPGCTVQACAIRDTKAQLKKSDIVVLGISPDPVDKIKKFVDKEKLNFNLLSDEGHKVADKYGVWAEKKFMGKTYDGIHRISFLIGEDGRLLEVMSKVKTKTHHTDALKIFKALES